MSELAGAVVVETSQLTLQLRTAAGLVVERLENTATGVMLAVLASRCSQLWSRGQRPASDTLPQQTSL